MQPFLMSAGSVDMPSFRRKPESIFKQNDYITACHLLVLGANLSENKKQRQNKWIPAFAGMTNKAARAVGIGPRACPMPCPVRDNHRGLSLRTLPGWRHTPEYKIKTFRAAPIDEKVYGAPPHQSSNGAGRWWTFTSRALIYSITPMSLSTTASWKARPFSSVACVGSPDCPWSPISARYSPTVLG